MNDILDKDLDVIRDLSKVVEDVKKNDDFYEFSEDYLAHFGIIGMKWGKRHGPPYPLDGSISTGKKLKDKKLIKEKRKLQKEEQKRHNKKIKEKIKRIKKERKELLRKRSTISNEDLNKVINRLKKEEELKKLLSPASRTANKVYDLVYAILESRAKRKVNKHLDTLENIMVGKLFGKEGEKVEKNTGNKKRNRK